MQGQIDDRELRNAGFRPYSRNDIHRVLKAHGVPHFHGGTLKELMQIMEGAGLTPTSPPPKAAPKMEKPKGKPGRPRKVAENVQNTA